MIISDALRCEMERDIEQCENCRNDIMANRLIQSLRIKYNGRGTRFQDAFADRLCGEDVFDRLSIISELFRMMLVESEEEKLAQSASQQEEKANPPQQQKTDVPTATAGTEKPRVFIVHGHDDAAKQEVARTLERAGFAPIILHEQASSGKTIIEKIEAYTDVCFGVILYTPCDLGRANKEDAQEKPRARQNVVFEHGYLIAKLKRERVCALVKDGVEIPGDMSGAVYIPMDSNGGWKLQLATEMRAVGLKFNLNTL